MTPPPKSWIEKYVRAAALNDIAARMGATIKVQQRMYGNWMKLRLEGEKKWPHVDFDAGLKSAINSWLQAHPMRGPGVDW